MRITHFILVAASFFICTQALSQGGQKWSVNGNATANGDFIGTTNNEPLVIKTDNVTRIRIHANGNIIFKEFDGLGFTGLFTFDANGKLVGVPFSGSPSDVYLGTGVFGNINALTGWFTSPGITYTNNNVGIGLTSPVEKLEVNGNAIFNGSVAASSFLVGDVTSTGKNLRISTNICLDGYDATTGMRNELCVFYKPLFINSKHGYDMNTVLNHDNLGNVGIGTDNPTVKLDLNGDFKVNGKSYFKRILPFPGDSVVYIGDSTLAFAAHNRIYPDYLNWTPSVTTRGTGIGHYSAFGHAEFSVGIGRQARSFANYSVSIGNYVRTSAAALNSIVMGSGVIFNANLENTIPNSMMIGFNSDKPTLFIYSADGIGTVGRVGVGTTEPDNIFEVGSGVQRLSIGSAYTADLKSGTSYVGFNVSRGISGGWHLNGDGAHNGGGLIYSTINGDMYFLTLPSSGAGDIAMPSDMLLLNTSNKMFLRHDGVLAIGTECIPQGFKLAVAGKIICEEVLVNLRDAGTGCWPDYVFDSTYVLKPIEEVESFVEQHKHLPGVPTEKEVIENGVALTEMARIQMEKIEELYLYSIEQNKKIEALTKEVEELKNANKKK
ncbi:MAG: hypothetical protein ACHQF2_07205 [Flavobacteriales bacterium]